MERQYSPCDMNRGEMLTKDIARYRNGVAYYPYGLYKDIEMTNDIDSI